MRDLNQVIKSILRFRCRGEHRLSFYILSRRSYII